MNKVLEELLSLDYCFICNRLAKIEEYECQRCSCPCNFECCENCSYDYCACEDNNFHECKR